MYPFYDSTNKPEVPQTPWGCFLYVAGFCLFVAVVVGFAKWML